MQNGVAKWMNWTIQERVMAMLQNGKQYTFHLSQEKYIEKVLDKFNVVDAKPIGVPLQPHVRLSKDDCRKDDDVINYMKNVPYASACGSLMYAMVATRPDIAHAVKVVSRFMVNPDRAHYEAIKSILRYLKGTKGKWLCYGKCHRNYQDYVIFYMGGNVDTHKSTS